MPENESKLSRRTVLGAVGAAAGASVFGGTAAGGSCGDRSDAGSFSGTLSGPGDYDCHTYSWTFADPCRVRIVLGGYGLENDFDLLVNDGETSCPTTGNEADYYSWDGDPSEEIVITDPDTSTDLYIVAKSYEGSDSYFITVDEDAY